MDVASLRVPNVGTDWVNDARHPDPSSTEAGIRSYLPADGDLDSLSGKF